MFFNNKRKRSISIIAMIIIFMLGSVVIPKGTVYAKGNTETLTIPISSDENSLTPYTYVTGYPGLEVLRLVFDSLFTVDKDNKVIPWMVEKCSNEEDMKVYKINLRKDLKWHDGKKVTADDVKFSFEYALTQNSSRWKKAAKKVKSVEIKDELNLVITLNNANPNFSREVLAELPIVPKHIYGNAKDATTVKETIGSGMYKLTEYKAQQYYKFEAVEDYFAGKPTVKKINMPIMKNESAVFQSLQTGEIAASTRPLAPELLKPFKENKNMEIIKGTGYAATLLYLNCEKYPFSEVKFRQAISCAVNIEDVINRVLLGYGDKGNPGFFNPDLSYAAKDLGYKYDINKGNALLDELGFTNKDSKGIRMDKNNKPLEFELLVYSGNAARTRSAELIAASLANIGIKVNVKAMESKTVDELVWPGFDVKNKRKYDMTMWGWSAPIQLDASSLVGLCSSNKDDGNLNIAGYKNQEFDNLCTKLKETSVQAERDKIVIEMQKLMNNETPFITLYYAQVINAYNKPSYNGWVMQKGTGIINKYSFLNSKKDASNNNVKSEGNSKIITGFIVGGAAIVIVGIFAFKKRKK